MTSSPLHKLDPRTKLVGLVCGLLLSVFIDEVVPLMAIFLVIILLFGI